MVPGHPAPKDEKPKIKSALEKCLEACETGDLDLFKKQVEESFDQFGYHDAGTLLGRTALDKDWVEGTRCLLEQGVSPNKIAFTTLARKGSVAILKLLAEFGRNFKEENERYNVLPFALRDREILDWLLDQGLDVNAPEGDARGSAEEIQQHDNTVAVLNDAAGYGDIELFDHLVSRGANPAHSNALHHAARSSDAATMIPHLIGKYNFDVDADDSCGGLNVPMFGTGPSGSPLNYAVSASNISAIQTLLKYGAGIGYGTQYAIRRENLQSLKLLLENGADASKALDDAVCEDFVEGCKLCLEYGADIAIVETRDREMPPNRSLRGVGSDARKALNIQLAPWNSDLD